MDGPEGRVGAGKREISVRFGPCGQCAVQRDAPGPDSRSFSGTRPSGARLSGGQPLHQEPEHGLVRAGAGQPHRHGAGISGDHRADLEQPKA